jgi:hypothetical protein
MSIGYYLPAPQRGQVYLTVVLDLKVSAGLKRCDLEEVYTTIPTPEVPFGQPEDPGRVDLPL